MNSDQVKGKVEHAVGHAKQAVGEAVGNNKLANEGMADQLKGAGRETWGNVKDASAVSRDEHAAVATDHATNARKGVSGAIDDAKNAINDHIDDYKQAHRR